MGEAFYFPLFYNDNKTSILFTRAVALPRSQDLQGAAIQHPITL